MEDAKHIHTDQIPLKDSAANTQILPSSIPNKVEIGDFYVGTAGFSYSEWRSGVFYPTHVTQRNELRHFSGVFPAVEINNTFHGIPKTETFRSWVRDSKDGFRFCLKIPQDITHVSKLDDSMAETWDLFLDRVTGGFSDNHPQKNGGCRSDALGPLLFQLPPSLQCNISKLHSVAKMIPPGVKAVFEFRHSSWYQTPEVSTVLHRYGFAMCENLSPDNHTTLISEDAATTAGSWCYARFYKRADRGVVCYSDAQLEKHAEKIAERVLRGVTQYAFFMNEHEGNGPRNAQTLMRMVSIRLQAGEQGAKPQKSLVKSWKADAVIQKGGKGSIQAMFAKSTNGKIPSTAATSKDIKRNSSSVSCSSKAASIDLESRNRHLTSDVRVWKDDTY